MKKKLVIFCISFLFVTLAQAQSIDKILKALQENPAVVHQTIGKELLEMALSKADSASQNKSEDLLQKISNVEIYGLKDCKNKDAGNILKAIDEYKDEEGYGTLLNVNKNGKNIRIVAHKRSEKSTEITILARTEDKIAFVKLEGTLELGDIQKLIDEQGDKL